MSIHPTHPVEPDTSPPTGEPVEPNPTQLPVEPEFGPLQPANEPEDPGAKPPHI